MKDVKAGAGREKNVGKAGAGFEIKDGTMAPELGNNGGKEGAGVLETKPAGGKIGLGVENVWTEGITEGETNDEIAGAGEDTRGGM